MPLSLRELLRVPGDKPMDLAAYDTRETPAGPRDKRAGLAAMTGLATPLADLQERLWAASTAGDRRRVLLVLQGMDTSGKGGTVKHVIGLFYPSGCRIHAFKAPHPRNSRTPSSGASKRPSRKPVSWASSTARSPIEDVLIARVRALAPAAEIERRYDEINRSADHKWYRNWARSADSSSNTCRSWTRGTRRRTSTWRKHAGGCSNSESRGTRGA